MSFENIDLQQVLDDVADSGLSVSQAGDDLTPEDVAQYRDIIDSQGGNLGIVVVDDAPDGDTGLRNLAQTVKDAGGDATVIVRSPDRAQVVSDDFTRFQIESNQPDLSGSRDPGNVTEFLQAAADAGPDFTALYAVILVCVVLAVAAAAGCAHVMYRGRR